MELYIIIISAALPFLNPSDRWGYCQTQHPGRFTPGQDALTKVQDFGWAAGPVWTGALNLAPPGFDPLTIQPVASRYINYTIPANR
jgi:hypothetical protein